ncbi:MAG: hypothetical protein HP496_13185 [Nitrospira sp.]|nr:hypothetical protein [Nitrospira sp.]
MIDGTNQQARDRLTAMETLPSSLRYAAGLLIALTLAFHATTSIAATTAYMSSTEQLDLRQVPLIVVAPNKLKAALHHRALTLFTEAGLPIPGSHTSQQPPSAVLTLTLDSRPIDDLCPGKVLYAPSLALTEPVTIPRTGSTIRDTTWLIESDKEVRGPVDDERIMTDLDGFIHQFITDYKTANRRPQERLTTPAVTVDPQFSLPPRSSQQQTDQELREIRVLSLSILAGRWSSALRANAVRQLTEAGLRLTANAGENGAISMSLELSQRALDDRCPGKVLYEQGVYLVEQVQVTRRPLVTFWSDTWLHESVRIVPTRSLLELEADQRLLLQKFLQAHETK